MYANCAVDECEYAPRFRGMCRRHYKAQYARERAIAGWPTSSIKDNLERTAHLLVLLSQRAGVSITEIREALGVRTDRMVYRWLTILRRVDGLALEAIDEEGELVAARSCAAPRYRLAAPPWKLREPLARRTGLPLPSRSPATAKEPRIAPRRT